MQVLQGIAVSPGIAAGEALVIDNEGFVISRRFIRRDEAEAQIVRLRQAMDDVSIEIKQDAELVSNRLGEQYGAILSAHWQMLRDPKLSEELEQLVRDEFWSPEMAIRQTLRRYAQAFQSLDNRFLADRAHDLFDLEKRLLQRLLGDQGIGQLKVTTPSIILAHDLTPGETARLDRGTVLGLVTEAGGEGSHTAILAKGLEIPAVVGTGQLLNKVAYGDRVIVDGDQGVVILQPDEATELEYLRHVDEHRIRAAQLDSLRHEPAVTKDGHRIELMANIEFPYEVPACLKRGVDGIGLYRTEFLYLGVKREPTEDDHYQVYRKVLEAMGDLPVIIRTLDLGADKMGHLPPVADEHNPCLGLRSIRLSLRNLNVFRIQLRALLRASVHGNARIMFPLITTIKELRQARLILREIMEDLEEASIPFDREIPIGMMVEVPAAVMLADRFLQEVDFISIGTNDLIQYALAVDRANKEVADLYQACDPAVLRLIDRTVREAQAAQVPAHLCGQMSATPHIVLLLLGLGLRGLSVPPSAVPEIKEVCRSVTIQHCEDIAQHAMQLEGAHEIDRYLKEELKKLVPLATTF